MSGVRVLSRILVLGIVVGGSACSSDSGLTGSQLAEKANAICAPHHAKISEGAGKLLAGGQLPDPKEFGKFAQETIIPELSAQITELRGLDPADDVSDTYNKWLDDFESTRDRIMKDPSLVTDAGNFTEVNSEADGLGLSNDCHIGPG